uniref:BRO1 domain-containing protein n=1 Tax=Strongyloides stercoralis TaxID=6248 RepID=A0A0K0E1K5_STRER
MVTFIQIPLKSTNEVDLVKPLKNFVKTFYKLNDDQKNEIHEAINELNKLRSKACCQGVEKSQAVLDLLLRYCDQLFAIENKLTITQTTNPVAFKWKDAFDKGSVFFSRASLTISDSSFERAAVLFNCGAMMSIIASSQLLNTDEELKSTAKLFQQASGIFSYLKDHVLGMVPQDPTLDLMPDTLASLSALMLAQAQEAIYIKAKKDQMKQTALVQLAAQCSEFYREAKSLMTREIVKGIWDKEWLNTISGKELAMNALGQYHQSQVAFDQKIIGETISRLNESIVLFKKASDYISSSWYAPDLELSKLGLEKAKKENDMIYHEIIPDVKTLPPLKKATIAKVIPYTRPLFPRFKDMFETLVPIEIQTAMSSFESRKEQRANMEVGRLREYTEVMNAILSSLNLPAALDDVTNHEKCPESIRQKSMKVKTEGGAGTIDTLIGQIPELYNNNLAILNETEKLLKEEKQTDDELREKFKDKWTRTKSEDLTGPLIQQIQKYRGILATASNADQVVKKRYDDNKHGIEILSKPENELINLIPNISDSSVNQNSETINKLRNLLDQTKDIQKERKKLEDKIKNVKIDVADKFLKARNDASGGHFNEEEISNNEIQKAFSDIIKEVDSSLKLQDDVLKEVEVVNRKFVQEKGFGNSDRDQMLKQLASAADVFNTLKSNLNEGHKFYNDLTPLLVSLQQNVSDFCFARQTEKEDLMKQVQQSIISGKGLSAMVSKKMNDFQGYVKQQIDEQRRALANKVYHENASSKQAPPRPPPPTVSGTETPPIPPPRTSTQTEQQATNQGVSNPQQPFYMGQQQPFNPYGTYNPYTAPPYFSGYPPQPQFGQPYACPYPVAYPGTYPGAGYAPQAPYNGAPQQQQQPDQQSSNNNPFT